ARSRWELTVRSPTSFASSPRRSCSGLQWSYRVAGAHEPYSRYAPRRGEAFMHPFLSAAIGGALIGVSAVLLMLFNGRIAGISGIVGGLLPPKPADDWRLRLAFIAGLLLAPLILKALAGFNGIGSPAVGLAILIPAGFLVGVGTALGNGCTSGHGICG